MNYLQCKNAVSLGVHLNDSYTPVNILLNKIIRKKYDYFAYFFLNVTFSVQTANGQMIGHALLSMNYNILQSYLQR